MPKDDLSLLAKEKQMASDVESDILAMNHPSISAKLRAAAIRQSQSLWQIRRGLALQPVPGLESLFDHWIQFRHGFENDAVIGFKNLNTNESRAVLARAAAKPNMPNDYSQQSVVYALADTRDSTYYPLMWTQHSGQFLGVTKLSKYGNARLRCAF